MVRARLRRGMWGADAGRSHAETDVADAAPELDRLEGRFPDVAGDLRRHTARGTIVNAAFRVGLATLTLFKRVLVAAFLTPAELGTWGIVLITLITLLFIKSAGISDKFVQQSESDQEAAFQKAFTIELVLSAAFILLAAALLPAFALAYDAPQIIVPGLVLLLAVVGTTFQAPTWIFYRQMRFVRQRSLLAIDPCVAFAFTIGLAAGGAGYWSLIIGAVVGSWAGGLAALAASPYRLKLRFDKETARDYFHFSWPLVVAQISVIVIAQGSMLTGSHVVGLAGVGAIALAWSIIAFSDGVDAIVTQTLYPAICAVRNRADLLAESFVKSNRLALMWGVPFGLGLALFASDLVHFVIGDKWEPAIFLLQVFGAMTALDQLGFNWTAFLRATNQTRPLAIVGVVTIVAFAAITIPLLILEGLDGYAIGMLLTTVIALVARTYFLAQLFSGFRMLLHAGRAIAPALPGVGAVLAVRLVESGERTLAFAIGELVLYVAVTVVATILLERSLLRETLGYLRRPQPAA